MVVPCNDDNETCDNAPRPESHPSLRLESRYDYSKRIDELSDIVIRVTALTESEDFKKMFKVTNALYEWHVAQNHFPDTRGQHRYGGRITLLAGPPLVPDEIPAAPPIVKGCRRSSGLKAFERMYYHSREMCNWIYDLYLYPNDFLDTRYNWDAAYAILLAACLSPTNEFTAAATLNSKSCTSLDTNAPMLRIQSESNERFILLDSPTRTLYTTMPEPTRTEVRVENQPEARPCSYQDYLDTLFLLETRLTVLYEHCKLEHRMTKEMYEWHLSQNHFTEKCSVILSKL